MSIRTTISRGLTGVCLAVAAGCGSNPDAPGIEDMFFRSRTVTAGSTATLAIAIFLEAHEDGGDKRLSDPFSVVITLPPGASYVPGSSEFTFDRSRAPDIIGSCGDGRTFLSYDFRRGEVDNSFNFEEFADDLSIDISVTLAADNQNATATTRAVPIADPCTVAPDAEAEFSVRAPS